MAFRRDSQGIAQLQKQAKEKKEQNIEKLQKMLKKRLIKQRKDIIEHYKKFLANGKKTTSNFEKIYKSTNELQKDVMSRLLKAIDAKSTLDVTEMFNGPVFDKLTEMKDFTSELGRTITGIYGRIHERTTSQIPALQNKVKEAIQDRIKGISEYYTAINNSLELMKKGEVDISGYGTLYDMVTSFPDYGTSLELAYKQGVQLIKLNIFKKIEQNADNQYKQQSYSPVNNPSVAMIETSLDSGNKELEQVKNSLKVMQQKISSSPSTNSSPLNRFLDNYVKKIEDPLLKMTFILGALHAITTSSAEYMSQTKDELNEYKNITSKIHVTAKDVAKKVGTGILKMIPAIIGVATGLGSTLSVLTDLLESLGWFLNAVAYAGSDLSGFFSEKTNLELQKVDSNIDMSEILLGAAGITTTEHKNNKNI